MGVNLALAGLSLQVIAMVAFSACFGDYLLRYTRHTKSHGGESVAEADRVRKFTPRVKVFFGFMAAAVLLILTRCAYRVAELHQGYSGQLITEQGLFIGLEGV